MAQFQKTSAKSIIRHPCGTYYLSAKIAGKKVRKSLKTSDLGSARMRRDDELGRLRGAAGSLTIKTVGEALRAILDAMEGKPGLKPNTVRYYKAIRASLIETLPTDMNATEWTREQVSEWWSAVAASRSATRANCMLQVVRKIGARIVADGLVAKNPTTGLSTMRIKRSSVDSLPSQAQVSAIVAEMRGQPYPASAESADMVEWFAWSGMRPAEVRALRWEDVLGDRVRVTGGEQGTKNHEVRFVPIASPLRKVIERRRDGQKTGPVFHIKSPKGSFRNAIKRLGMHPMRLYDLRHIFATHALESGVDVPTVAKWLGHKDGGALAMRTYGHIRDDHSLAQIKKLDP